MKNSGGQNRRRNYFIKKGFQAGFIIKFCLLLILACLIMFFVSYLFTGNTTTTSFENLRLTVKSTSDFMLPILLSSGITAVVLVSIATIAIVLFISHRIAGPLYRLEKSLEDIAGGDLTADVHLRQADEVKTLAETLNRTMKVIREPLAASKARTVELEAELSAIRDALGKKGISGEDIERIVKPAEKKVQQVKQNLSFFKLSLILALGVALALSPACNSAYASITAGGAFSDGSDWTTVKSTFCTIFFKDKVDVRKVNDKIDTYRIDFGLSEKPIRASKDPGDEIAYKFDLIFFKVQEILDMRPRDLHLNVRIYKGQSDLDRVYVEIFNQDNKFIAFYIFKLDSLFASEEKISANVMAHEIAHCVVDHYFSVLPPSKVAEMIAQYADVHLRD
ncbi:MAG: HAMP domain-containing protein [Dehalococcoidales bacterium]|jgi:HAMP domain-containing protein